MCPYTHSSIFVDVLLSYCYLYLEIIIMYLWVVLLCQSMFSLNLCILLIFLWLTFDVHILIVQTLFTSKVKKILKEISDKYNYITLAYKRDKNMIFLFQMSQGNDFNQKLTLLNSQIINNMTVSQIKAIIIHHCI